MYNVALEVALVGISFALGSLFGPKLFAAAKGLVLKLFKKA